MPILDNDNVKTLILGLWNSGIQSLRQLYRSLGFTHYLLSLQRGLSWYGDQEETLFRVVPLSNRCVSGAAPGRLNSKIFTDLPLVQVANPSLTPIL
jgi:hypothetical protein